MFAFGYNSGDRIILKDGREGIIIHNVIGTTTFRLELLEDGKRSGEVITRDREEFRKVK